jgi:uncharacterized protein (TIGR00297 family)
MLSPADYTIITLLLAGAVASVWLRKLTLPAALTGCLCGYSVYKGGGYTGLVMMAFFFLAGTIATNCKTTNKTALEPGIRNRNQRTTGQALANAGVAALAGIVGWIWPAYWPLSSFLIAAAFSAATADTLASELGTVYGKRFYNILTAKPDRKGLDGVVSLEGTLIGLAGTLCIALIYAASYSGYFQAVVIMIAGNFGNVVDSVLGAWLERKALMKNNTVNFLATLASALLAGIVYVLTY